MKIVDPLPIGQEDHPDWHSLKVMQARTNLDLCPYLDNMFGFQLNLDTLKRVKIHF